MRNLLVTLFSLVVLFGFAWIPAHFGVFGWSLDRWFLVLFAFLILLRS